MASQTTLASRIISAVKQWQVSIRSRCRWLFALPAISRSAATCMPGQSGQNAELLLGLQGLAEYLAQAHTRRWTSWQQAAGARRAQEMRRGRRAPATGAALAAGARRTSSATSWAASTWMRSTAAPATARVGRRSMIPSQTGCRSRRLGSTPAPCLQLGACCISQSKHSTIAFTCLCRHGLRQAAVDAGLNTLPQSSSSSRLHPGMIQRSDRETRVLIVEGINTDKREEDYSRKFQVCLDFSQQTSHKQRP